MPLDYSKWDALELSDDSDIEVHPNVDKRSFIKAKQAQIHAQRDQRKHQIETLKYERIINDQLMKRITALLNSLKSHEAEAKAGNPGEVAFKAVFESTPRNPDDDMPPPRPSGVHTEQQDSSPMPSYTKMMATLLDQVNQTLEGKKPTDRYQGMVEEVGIHLSKVEDLQKELIAKLAELEKEEKSKITSESFHTGFDSSQVNKPKPAAPASADKGKKTTSSSVELLNPTHQAPAESKTAGKVDDDDDAETTASEAAKQFGALNPDDFSGSLSFLGRHSEILSEKDTDGLLILAFDAELEKRPVQARNYVHQALLLQYCRALGKDGVALFFRKITTPGHQARDVFFNDVKDTYGKIRTRAAEILAQTSAESGGVEQIQLHAMEPGTVINIKIPAAGSDDAEVQQARAIFDSFKPAMKAALESGELEKVNKVLGEMKVEEAEELVGKFGDAGILSLEEEIIDATTEEGKKHLKDMEEERAQELAAGEEARKTPSKYNDDPE